MEMNPKLTTGLIPFCFNKRWLSLTLISAALLHLSPPAIAQSKPSKVSIPPSPTAKTEREWIWYGDSQSESRRGDAYFRRVMDLPDIEKAFIEFEADESCEVFVNGKRVGTSKAARSVERVDVSTAVRAGKNIIAIRASNRQSDGVGLKIGFMFKPIDSKG